MALRTIRVQGDSVLTKKSRTVDKMTPRIGELITDMLDTMYDAMGVGLAAPQVTRPNYVKVKALDVNMEEQIYEGEGLLARAFCHEIDHLDGKMYTELVEGELHKVTYDEED